jgi:hypothetical protein
VVVIPKEESPTNLRQFHPISSCNVVYKLITKALVNILQPYPDDLQVGPLQSSFVPGNGTTNNALIAQEVIHHMTRSKSKRGTTITWIIWFSLHLHTTFAQFK